MILQEHFVFSYYMYNVNIFKMSLETCTNPSAQYKEIMFLSNIYTCMCRSRGYGDQGIFFWICIWLVCGCSSPMLANPTRVQTHCFISIHLLHRFNEVIQVCIQRLLIMIQISNTVHRVTYTSFKIIMLIKIHSRRI